MQRQEVITAWHDRLIGAGEEWKHEIDENLERADLILLLVSSDFIASDYCYDEEMTRALQRHDAGKARVIPVIVRDVNWSKAPFAKLQALPKDGKAVTLWPDRDCACATWPRGSNARQRSCGRRGDSAGSGDPPYYLRGMARGTPSRGESALKH